MAYALWLPIGFLSAFVENRDEAAELDGAERVPRVSIEPEGTSR